jgi:hypothetical protein
VIKDAYGLKVPPFKGPSYADVSPPPYLRTDTDLFFKTLYHIFLWRNRRRRSTRENVVLYQNNILTR